MLQTHVFVSVTFLAVSVCAQTTTWTSFADRRGHAMASTAAGGVVMFGGQSVTTPGQLLDDTDRLSTNNQTWTQGEDGPAPRSEHAMAATIVAGQPVYIVFGGHDPVGVPSNRTWRYDGSAWGDITIPAALTPAARTGHAMVSNPVTQSMLLIGGYSNLGLQLNDVWELNPSTGAWNEHTTFGAPTPRFDHALAYHPGTFATDGRVYMFGGTPFLNELWEFNPFTDTWANVTPATSPAGRRKSAMAYVAGLGTIVMFGGQGTGLVARNDTWSWDRSTGLWTQEPPLTVPPARFDHAVAADNGGNKLVMLGGAGPGGLVLEGTWEWDGADWLNRLPSPSSRDGASMAYDSTRNRHVVFGGRATVGGVDLDETWEIDGLNWRKRTPTAKPSPRSDAGMAFDKARSRTVLYGGRSQATGELGDTWEWTGSVSSGVWALRFPSSSPPAAGGTQPVFDSMRNRVWLLVGSKMWSYDGTTWLAPQIPSARTGMGLCYDTARNRLVMFGGDEGGIYSSETWEWDSQRWWRLATGTPSPRQRCALVYDPVRQQSVLAGGAIDPSVYSDCHTWNGVSWSPAPGMGVARAYSGAVFDDRANPRVLLVGGLDQAFAYYADSLAWNGASWSFLGGVQFSPVRVVPAVAFAPNRQRIVLFGGQVYSGGFQVMGDTWEHDGAGWVQQNPATSPAARTHSGMAFDSNSGRVILFGGATSSTVPNALGDTWAWDGVNWTQLSPSSAPSARVDMAVVNAGTRLLMFGGQTANGRKLNELWGWTGSDWQLVDSGEPAVRTNYGAAYDARRDRTVVFGGMTTNVRASAAYNSETWEWNGGAWLQRFPSSSPSPRGWCKLTFDEARGRVVMYGGADAVNTFQDTWEWDGTDWIQQIPVANAPGSYGHDLTFDQARRLTIAFGSFGTWDYGPVTAASITPYGAGCATSAGGMLALKPLPWSGPWMGERLEMDFQFQPPGLGIFVWGFSNTFSVLGPLPVNLAPFGSPNCFLRASADLTELIFPGTTRYVSFVLPNHPSFLGARMYGQAGFFDAGLPGVPIVTSNGIEMLFGQK